MWRICTICGARTDAFVCEKDGNSTDTIRSDTVFPGRLFPDEIVLENYAVGDLIGVGGMGAVYRGEQKTTHQAVAIKVLWRDLAKDPVEVKRFTREARAASLLTHPNAVRVFDFGVDPKSHAMCMIMEYLVGQKLSDALRRSPVLDPVRTVHIVSQVAKALEESHRKGIVHRDVKPDNIFLQEIAGERDFAKILDFGLAKFVAGDYERDQLTRTGYVVGSPEYMAPEQASGGEVSAAADIYSLGIVLYECLTGKLPFDATTTAEVLRKHILQGAPRLIQADNEYTRDIPMALEDVVLRCLDKDPANRPATADALRIQLLQACDRRRLNTVPNMTLPGMVVAPTSLEESGLHPRDPGLTSGYSPRPSGIQRPPSGPLDVPASLQPSAEPPSAPPVERTGETDSLKPDVIAKDSGANARPPSDNARAPSDEVAPPNTPKPLPQTRRPVTGDLDARAESPFLTTVPGQPAQSNSAQSNSAQPNPAQSSPSLSPDFLLTPRDAIPASAVRPDAPAMSADPRSAAPAPYAPGAVEQTTDAGRASPPLADALDDEGAAPTALHHARPGAAGIVAANSISAKNQRTSGAFWAGVAIVAAAGVLAAWYFAR